MPWVRLDDQLPDHLKFVGIDLPTMGLWSLTLIDSARRLTDGFVPASEPRRYRATKRHVDELVRRGLWEPVEGGWQIHDFHDYQPTAESVRRQRDELSQARAEAGRKGARNRWQPDSKRHSKPDGNTHGNPMANGMAPVPKPLLVTSQSSSLPGDARADDDDGRVIRAALDEVGLRRYKAAEQAGKIKGDPDGYRITCQANAHRELLELAERHLADHPDATAEALADLIQPRPETVPPGMPRCADCGERHQHIPGLPCPPSEVTA